MTHEVRWRAAVVAVAALGVASGCKREAAEHAGAPAPGARGSAAPATPPELIAIDAAFDGAAAAQVEAEIVEPLEQAVSALPGVRSIRSTMGSGRGVVVVELDGPDAASKVQRAVADALRQLPRDVVPPVIRRGDPDAPPAIWLAVAEPGSASPLQLADVVRGPVVHRLEQLAGVASVELRGVASHQITIQLDPARLDALAVTVADVQTALGATLDHAGPPPLAPQTLGGIELARRAGSAIQLRDVAAIEDGSAPPAISGPPLVGIRLQPGADPRQVARDVRATAAELAATLPHGWTLAEAPAPADVEPPRALAITVRGPDWDVLVTGAARLTEALRARTDLVTHVASNHRAATPTRVLTPDRDAALRLGITLPEVATTLRGLLVGPGRIGHTPVVLRLAAGDPLTPEALDRVRVRTTRGALVPLARFATLVMQLSPTLTRRDRERAITIAADLAPGQSRDAVQAQLAALAELPPGYRTIVLPSVAQ